jgi:hypothetical protein
MIILIIYDQTRTDGDTIYNIISNTDEHLEFKISRNTNNIDLDIYRKPTYMDITIHFSSNHPYDHKIAAFKYYINRMITVPITKQVAKQEWNKIIIMARNNGFPEQIIHKLRSKLITKRDQPPQTQPMQQHMKRWIAFTCYGPLVLKVTNLFKRTDLQIAFRPTNTIHQQRSQKTSNTNTSGIYQLTCNTCKTPMWDSPVEQWPHVIRSTSVT